MTIVFRDSKFEISTSFGWGFVEGNVSSGEQGAGRTISFTVNNVGSQFSSVYMQIVPVDGQTSDFWENFFSNIIGGEPADQFALSAFVPTAGGTSSFLVNADRFVEQKLELFEIRLYGSATDPGFGRPPLATARFSIVDDDKAQFGSPGAPLVSNFNVANGWLSQEQAPRHVADVNGDGFSDIVGFGFAGVLVSFGSAGGTFGEARVAASNFGQTAGWLSDNQFRREIADVNGDSRADIIGFGVAGTLVSLAKADGSFDNPSLGIGNFGTNQGWTAQDRFARLVGDVNGDGKADILGFGQVGTLVSLGNGDGTFKAPIFGIGNFGVDQGWSSGSVFHRDVADVNGDGFDDIIGFGQAGTLVALANGDGTFKAPVLGVANFGVAQGWTTQDRFTRVAEDVNNDGFADIVGFGAAGTFIAYGNSSGGFTEASFDVANFSPAQGWSSDNLFHRTLADINNDGLIDIVGFGVAGVLGAYNHIIG